MSARRLAPAAWLPWLLLIGACNQDPLTRVRRIDAGAREAGAAADATADARREARTDRGEVCVPDPNGEVCDGLDNDCNGTVDDVPPALLQSDAKNCGACGHACSLPNAFTKCQGGVCVFDSCAPGFWDLNQKQDDGCEYKCLVSNGGVEACDDVDNNCDGVVDEGFGKDKDPNNCGLCGKRCLYNHASASCVAGVCQMDACEPGFADINKDSKDGCEYGCPVWPAESGDLCDGVDNDCDGQVDEDFVGEPCGQTGGACQQGQTACVSGNVVCQGAVGPKPEFCNDLDDDCNGTVDDGFDKQNDPRTCGSCKPCSLAHAIAGCSLGSCVVAVCEVGWVDLDKDPLNGCEYH
jgi:hypothetical protein